MQIFRIRFVCNFQGIFKAKSPPQAPPPIIVKMPLWQLAQESGPFVRLAGISGAAAVVLGAMGAHRTFPDTDAKEDLKKIFETANRFHFLHTLALVTVPLCRRPYIVSNQFSFNKLLMYFLHETACVDPDHPTYLFIQFNTNLVVFLPNVQQAHFTDPICRHMLCRLVHSSQLGWACFAGHATTTLSLVTEA